MKQKCHIAESGTYDTAGKPVMVVVCYCGTTSCQSGLIQDYPLPKDYSKLW